MKKLSRYRYAHFMAQCHHESGGFRYTEENLNYSDKALLAVFGKYYTKDLAIKEARKPELIANRVYGNRMGNDSPGDGWKHRGRGFIQLTGKDNYKAFSEYIGVDCVANPELVSTTYPYESALWFFDKNNLWCIADLGIENYVIRKITRRINGGFNGISDRIELTKHYYNEYMDKL